MKYRERAHAWLSMATLIASLLQTGCGGVYQEADASSVSTTDRDGDGFEDEQDVFPDDPTEWADQDGDGVGDNHDNCTEIVNADQGDLDSDGTGDACDDDRDGDGRINEVDGFPDDPEEWEDSDGDGTGDNADPFPHNPGEWLDSDRDGIGNNRDNCPEVANPEQSDIDSDGLGDQCDNDADNDGYASSDDCDDMNPEIIPGTEVCPWSVGGMSCRSILESGSSRGDGVYRFDPDGVGEVPPVTAYCDMTTDGGGWTALINPAHMSAQVFRGVTISRTVVSGTGSCNQPPNFSSDAHGYYRAEGYACGNHTIQWGIDWPNVLQASDVRFTAALQGQQIHNLSLNNVPLSADAVSNAYMTCAFWNGTSTATDPARNACHLASLDEPAHVYPGAIENDNLSLRMTTGRSCSPDCQHGTGFNLQKLFVR